MASWCGSRKGYNVWIKGTNGDFSTLIYSFLPVLIFISEILIMSAQWVQLYLCEMSQDFFTAAGTEKWGEMKCTKNKDGSSWPRCGDTCQFG